MARFAARFVGWYTSGGFVDECGAEHKSGFHYNWTYLSVLNEAKNDRLQASFSHWAALLTPMVLCVAAASQREHAALSSKNGTTPPAVPAEQSGTVRL